MRGEIDVGEHEQFFGQPGFDTKIDGDGSIFRISVVGFGDELGIFLMGDNKLI